MFCFFNFRKDKKASEAQARDDMLRSVDWFTDCKWQNWFQKISF